MIISLLGYMGSGKTHVSKLLSNAINFELIDLDDAIEEKTGKSIPELFEERGEIYFRKIENQTLTEILQHRDDLILSLGGGTPVYYNNMELINQHSVSVYLRTSVTSLSERLLRAKHKRPIIERIPKEDLPEFIAKHLFERNAYYSQAHHIFDTDQKSLETVSNEIKKTLLLEFS